MNGEASPVLQQLAGGGETLVPAHTTLCFASGCLVNQWFAKNPLCSEPCKLAVIGREQLMAGLTEHHLAKALPHGLGFPCCKDTNLMDS